jgi:hypothetical protein
MTAPTSTVAADVAGALEFEKSGKHAIAILAAIAHKPEGSISAESR